MDKDRLSENETGEIPELSSSNELETELSKVILRSTGIVIQSHQLSNLGKAIVSATSHFGFKNTREFIDFIKEADAGSVELEFIISAITVGESYFFRDMEQIEFIRDEWLPRIVEKRRAAGDKSLRIWSAGASNGQELYSIAIILMETIEDIYSWNLHLLGTDINTGALARSVEGRYRDWSFRSTGESIKAKYFIHENAHYTVRPELKRMVKFSYLNLIDSNYPSMLSGTTAIDLILCKNVLMYLDQGLIGDILGSFTASLSEGGVLMVGASGSIAADQPGLVLSSYSKTPYFQKKRLPSAEGGDMTQHKAPQAPPERRQSMPEGIDRASYERIAILDKRGEWNELTAAVDEYTREHGPSELILSMKAKALASTGDLKGALKTCKKSIDADPSGKHSYFIKALVLIELDRVDEALTTLKKVIYLDPYFIEAHFQIGMLQIRNNRRSEGVQSLKNALEITERGDRERITHISREMTYARFIEVLKSEISIYDK